MFGFLPHVMDLNVFTLELAIVVLLDLAEKSVLL